VVQVRTPAGAPADADLSLIAIAADGLGGDDGFELLQRLRRDPERGLARAAVLANGETRLRVPAETEVALLIDGSFLYLEEPRVVSASTESVLLEPLLGASVVVRLRSGGADLDGELALAGGSFGGGRRGWNRLEREVDGAERYRFGALDTELTWSLMPDFEDRYAPSQLGIELEPGEERLLELEVSAGGSVEGQVRDASGEPVAGIEVRTAAGPMAWMGGGGGRETVTDAEGNFSLRALEPGEQQLETRAEGWRDGESETFTLEDGQEVRGLLLTIDRGETLAGIVRWSDGSPAAGASVVAETRTSGGWGGWGGSRLTQAGSTTSGADGSFALVGLDSGSYTLRASHDARSAEDEAGAARWHAAREAVAAGSTGVELRLEGPIPFEGTVVDDRGEPVTAFELRVESAQDGGPEESQDFEDEGGRFLFARVGPGEWTVEARADGHIQLEARDLMLGAEGQEVELRLERTATVSGRVLDPGGAPVAGARVRAEVGTDGGNPWRGPSGPNDETDAEGRYLLEGLRPGTVDLSASREGWADSEDLVMQLAPGSSAEGTDLALRVGGTIIGTVLTPEGDGIAGKRVTWGSNAMGFGSEGETTTDSAGAFRFDNVTPGEWAVSAAPSMAEMGESMRGRRGNGAFTEIMGQLVTETVTVVDRETVEVHLGGEPRRPVRVYGRVTLAGEAVVDANVVAVSEASAVFEGMKSVQTDDQGNYELVVDRPGAHTVSVTSGRLGVALPTRIPEAEEVRVDLAIPLGSIEGVVKRSDGRPAAGVRLSIQREDGLGRMRWGGDQATSDEAGRYALVALEPGRYTVRANVSTWGGRADPDWGTLVRDGIQVTEDQTVDGVDFRLSKAGSVEGVVVGLDGQPVEGASVFFRDGAGRLLSTVSGTTTNAAGEFRRTGLAPGDYELSLRASGLAAEAAANVRVVSEEESTVRLTLEAGTTLIVTLDQGDEAVGRARYEVFDEDGREIGGLMTVEQMRSTFNQGGSQDEVRLGPVPAGRYVVRATMADGRTAERKTTVRGRLSEKRVRLKLDS